MWVYSSHKKVSYKNENDEDVVDELDENDESFAVTLSNASHGSIQADTAIVTILDEDDAPSISISGNNNIAESENLDLSVTLAQASGKTITIFHTNCNSLTDCKKEISFTFDDFILIGTCVSCVNKWP